MRKDFSEFYLKQLRRVWRCVPISFRHLRMVRPFARHVDRVARHYSDRSQHFATFFLRNRAELQLLRRLVEQTAHGSQLRMTILACSKGAEVYSMAWTIRSARPDIDLCIHAIDVAPEIVEFAARGVYCMRKPQPQDLSTEEAVRRKNDHASIPSSDQHAWIFERLSEEEIESMFEVRGDEATIRAWLRKGITWQCGDAGDPKLPAKLGKQDIVVANRFLCHMVPEDAERCLRNLDRFVRPGGYLFVNGVDLDVRCKIVRERGWSPVTELLREIHACDDLLSAWPVHYWGVEPLDEERSDWQLRYASVFQIAKAPTGTERPITAETDIQERMNEAENSFDDARFASSGSSVV